MEEEQGFNIQFDRFELDQAGSLAYPFSYKLSAIVFGPFQINPCASNSVPISTCIVRTWYLHLVCRRLLDETGWIACAFLKILAQANLVQLLG